MAVCAVETSPEFKKLEEAIDRTGAYNVFYSLNNKLPSLDEIPDIVKEYRQTKRQKARLNQRVDVKDLINMFQNPDVKKLDNEQGYYDTKREKKVSHRVTELVEIAAERIGINYTGEDNPFFAQKGTVMHTYLEEILKSVVDPKKSVDQIKVQEEVFKLLDLEQFKGKDKAFMRLTPIQFKTLVKGIRSLVNEINEIQREIDPNGKATFFPEVPVLDHIQSVAGTIDLAVVFSDGSMGVYDYKSFSRKGRTTAPGGPVVDKWSMQLGRYKSILRDIYGVDKFRQSRIIPIKVDYSERRNGEWVNQIEEGFSSVAMQNKDIREKTSYLDAIPVEEYTGDENLDRLVAKLLSKKQETQALLNKAKIGEQGRLRNLLSRLNSSLKNIQLKRDSFSTVGNIRDLYTNVRKRLGEPQDSDLYLTDQELYDFLQETKIYDNIAVDFENQANNITDKKDRREFKQRLAAAQDAVQNLQEMLIREAEDRIGRETLKMGKNPGRAKLLFYGLEDVDIPVFKRLRESLRDAEELTRRRTLEEFTKIREIDEKFTKWANSNGYRGLKKFELLYDSDKGTLHSQYSKEFIDRKSDIIKRARKQEKLSKEDRAWLKKYFVFDEQRYEEVRNKVIDNVDYEIANGFISKAQGDKVKANFYKTHSIKSDESNFFTSGYLKPNEETASEYTSKEWNFIQDNKPLKDYYDMYIEYNTMWTEEFGRDLIGKNFVANVKRNMFDQLLENGVRGLGDLATVYKKSLEIHQQDDLSGAIDAEGNQLSSIPLLYTDPVYTDPSAGQKEKIRQEVAVTHGEGTPEFEQEVARRIKEKGKQLGRSAKSSDLTKSLMAMVYSVNQFANKSAIEGQIKLMQLLVHEDRVTGEVSGYTNKPVVRQAQGDILKKIGLEDHVKEAFDEYVDMLLYGRKLKSDVEVKGYSVGKTMNKLMNYMSVRSLGLDVTIQTADYIQGKSSMHMMAREGRYLTKKGFKDTIKAFGRKDEQFKRVAEYFQPESRDIVAEQVELSGATTVSRNLRQRSLFIGYIWSDDNISKALLGSMSKHYVVDSDGKIKNPKFDKILDENAPTVYDSVQEKDGKLSIDNLSIEEFAKFREKVQRLLFQIRGSMNERQKGLINRLILGQSLMHFRHWIPGLGQARFGELRYDPVLENFERGRFSAAMGEIIGTGILPAVKETLAIIAETVSMGLYKKNINMQNAKQNLDKFLAENPHYKRDNFDINDYIQLQRDKLNGFISELRMYIAFFVTVQLLGGLDWDDEEEGNLFTYNANQIARRALLELSFFWDPSSVNEIIKSPIAIWGQLTEFEKMLENGIIETSYAIRGDRNERDKTPFGYYTLKNTPVINQVLDISGYFNRYNPRKSLIDRMFEDEEDED